MHILFISHSGGRTGAPYLLLDLLRWFRDNTGHTFQILLKYDGPLREEFARLAETVSWAELTTGGVDPGPELDRRYAGVDLIYSNTGTNGHLLAALARLNRPVVTHLHEMRYALAMWGENAFDHVLAQTTQWICASRPVLDNLRAMHGVDPSRPVIIADFIDPPAPDQSFAQDRAAFLASLGSPHPALADPVRIVLGVGTFDWRKGADLFLQVAGRTLRRNPDPGLHFVWIGDEGLDETARLRADIEIQGMGIGDRLHLCGFRDNIRSCIAQAELFLLPSREDPCPLVALEAAALGRPVLCFERAGGIADLARRGGAVAVDYMDVAGMSDQIARLLGDPDARRALGERGAELVRLEYNLDRNARTIEAMVQKTVHQFPRATSAAPPAPVSAEGSAANPDPPEPHSSAAGPGRPSWRDRVRAGLRRLGFS